MPRKARVLSASGIYHVIMRGINRQTIFVDDEDCAEFIRVIKHFKKHCCYQIYVYCLMGNHVHLLLKVGEEPLQTIMRRICGKYVLWYNKKHDRIGYLFQDRFKSEPVEDETYFITVQRYIHQNPLKAGLVSRIGDYRWSSYVEYIGQCKLIDADFLLNLFGEQKDEALREFILFTNQSDDVSCLDVTSRNWVSDKEARLLTLQIFNVESTSAIHQLVPALRKECLKTLKNDYGLSIRQIERVTGINRGEVFRA